MHIWLTLALSMLFLGDADLPRVENLRPPTPSDPTFSPTDAIPLLPALNNEPDMQAASQQNTKDAKKSVLQDQSRFALIRYVSGEFAKAVKPLPSGKDGFQVTVGKPLDETALQHSVAVHGAAVNTGDQVQITKLEFRARSIVVDVNGGGRGKHHWRDHIQVGIGGGNPIPGPRSSTQKSNENGPPGMQPGAGSTVFLEFGKPVPDLTPDELKQLLAPFLNFAKERSASVQWIDTLPAEMKQAITERRPVIGMDREEVVAAIGKPDRKVRERDAEGRDTEDWIYGTPPAKTIFVRFMGERVTAIKQYPR
ncbi:MAG TPA: hypothetical protein VN982_12345 [Candidatus Dormibacteraeota bacterium]|nr:hypothetical protein [Candidatus Dormibacteraeota bacterium]